MVGQSVGLVRDIPSCAELLERMTREAEERVSAVRDRIR
jgi:NAD(P)H-dependent flavin oxidoreductase YrpB (nitropropane dioxygenase family)